MLKLLMAAVLWAGMAQAGGALTVEERLVAGLQDQGYRVVEKGYTFLGRLRIVAENDKIHREIVVNPGTGEILRDYAVYISDMPQALPDAQVATRGGKAAPAPHASTATRTGTAGVAALALTPGSTILGRSSIQVDTSEDSSETPLDDTILPLDGTILPMTSGLPTTSGTP